MIGWADGSVHRIDIFATTLAKQVSATIESTTIKDLGESSFNYRGSSDSFFASEDSVVSRFRRGRGENGEESPLRKEWERKATISVCFFYEIGWIATKDFIDEGSLPPPPRNSPRGNRQERHITNGGKVGGRERRIRTATNSEGRQEKEAASPRRRTTISAAT